MRRIGFLLGCAAALAGTPTLMAGGPPTAARLSEATCTAHVRANGSSPPSTLRAGEQGHAFSAGQQVACASTSGYLVIVLATGPRRITADEGWFTIPTLEIQSKQRDYRQLMAEALEHHSPRPAASRGASQSSSLGVMSYPTPYAAVLPDAFKIRWKPLTTPGRIHFRMVAPGAAEALWTEEANAAAGVLDSPGARAALLNDRRQHDGELLVLEWSTGEAAGSIPFATLKTSDEGSLQQELAFWDDNKDEVTRLLGRAYSYDARELYWEAAQEYEAALQRAPASCALLEEARNANYTAGNADRVKELQQTIDTVPNGCPASH